MAGTLNFVVAEPMQPPTPQKPGPVARDNGYKPFDGQDGGGYSGV
jgi:hypothetical protein